MNTMKLIVTILCLWAAASAASQQDKSRLHTMEFHTSSFLVNRAPSTAPHGIAVPVTVQLLNLDGTAVATNAATPIVVTAAVTAGSSISGNVATVTNGVAQFMMTFTSCTGGIVTFTAHTADGSSITLQSGFISVAPVPNAELLFDASSTLQVAQPAVLTAGKNVRPFKINLYDSCGTRDTTMTGLTITATTSSGSLAGETTATFTDGVALFASLQYKNAVEGSSRLTFTVDSYRTPVAASKQLVTGDIIVQPAGTQLFGSYLPMVAAFVGMCLSMLAAVVYFAVSRQQQSAKFVPVSSVEVCTV